MMRSALRFAVRSSPLAGIVLVSAWTLLVAGFVASVWSGPVNPSAGRPAAVSRA
jgi:hypothetical protein